MADKYHFEAKGDNPRSYDVSKSDGPSEEDDEPEKQFTVGDLVKHFIETTGAPAVQDVAQLNGPYFIRRPFYFWRVLWALVWLICWFGFCYQMTFLVLKYQGDPVYINLEIKSEERLTFPGVTVCNVNPVKKSYLLATKNFQTLGTLDESFAYTFEKEAIEDAGGDSSQAGCSSDDGMFQCKDMSSCIPKSWQCDGTDDCEDKSDEIDCSDYEEEPNQGECTFGFLECPDDSRLCIKFEQKCDGRIDCQSGWDESVDEGCPVITDEVDCPPQESDPVQVSTSESYTLTAPKQPTRNEYRPNKNCYWLFQAPEGQSLFIEVDKFNLEASKNCENDYLRIVEYRNDGHSFYDETFCGIEVEREIHIFSNQVFIQFQSDSGVNKEGFRIQIIAKAHENLELRLEGSLPKAGLLLGYSEAAKTWKTFCLSAFVNSNTNIAVACEELDFKFSPSNAGVTAASTTSKDFDVTKYTAHEMGLNCNIESENLLDCETVPGVTCTSDSYVFLSCEASFDNGQLRLVPTISDDLENIGRVEVYYEGSWGTICQDSFGAVEANVVCKQLGYEKGAMYSFTAGETDPGRGPVWLDNMDCDGTESRINQCGNNGWGISNCRHSEDVGVACRIGVEEHFCIPTATSTFSESQTISPTIACSGREVLYPLYAQFGFLETDICLAEAVTNCRQDGVAKVIWDQCNGLSSCNIITTGFNNPCSHKRRSLGRELDVLYNCTEAYCDFPFIRNGDSCFYIGVYSNAYPLDLTDAQQLCEENAGTPLISDHSKFGLFDEWASNLGVETFIYASGREQCQVAGGGEPADCIDRPVTSFICQKRTYSVLGSGFRAKTESKWSEWTDWNCTSPCQGDDSIQLRTRQCLTDLCQGDAVQVIPCSAPSQPSCDSVNSVSTTVTFELKSYMGGLINDQLFLDYSTLGYKYLLYHVSTLIEFFIEEYRKQGFVADGYRDAKIESGLDVSFTIVVDPVLSQTIQSITDLTVAQTGPFSVDETTDFREELKGVDLVLDGGEGGNAQRARRSSNENKVAWEWFESQPTSTEDDSESNKTRYLEQFDNLEPFDWKRAIAASQEDDYSDFRTLALFEENVIENYGHQLVDMIVQCTFDGVTCSVDDFDVIKNPFYGNCFVFNQKHTNRRREIRETSKTGMQWGLKLTLFLEAEEYIGVLSHMPGGRLSLTSEDTFATPEDQGVIFAPGQLTSIATRYTEIKRKSAPYSDCISEYPKFSKIDTIVRGSFTQFKYNIRVCINLCVANRLLEECQCVDQYFFNITEGTPLCDPWNSTTRNCRQGVYSKYEKNQLVCGCQQACEDRNFGMTLSQSDWPAEYYAPYLLSKLRKGGLGKSAALKAWTDRVLGITGGNGSSFDLDNILGEVRKNLARVEVYYEELNYEKLTEIPAYTLVSLVSDFGGNIGLWTGVCAFNIFEVVRLLVDMGILAFNRRVYKKQD